MNSTCASFIPMVAGTAEPVRLSMQRLWLTGQVLAAGARLIVQHVFRSEEQEQSEVIYSFPLPRDAAMRRFRITGDGFESYSELIETEAAIKAYEEGIAQGSLSALARQYGDGIVNLTVGNVRPGETVTVCLEILAGVELKDDGFRFRFPFTLAPCYHAKARVAMISPGEAEMELPTAEFGDLILPRFRDDATALHQIGFELSLTSTIDLDEVGSPSHSVRIRQEGSNTARIALATASDVPDRDLVLDARAKSVRPQILAGRDKAGVGHFALIVPSTIFGEPPESPRRVVILLDRSGSMSGAPLAQARKAIEACLGALSDADFFGLVAFGNSPEVFQPSLQPATREARRHAGEFLNRIDARGGTELAQGVLAAAKLLKSGGDILILTDGQVAGTESILEIARSTGVRLHCLGIGSASQDRFLTLLARETGGISQFVTPRERVDLSAVDLFACMGRPIAMGLKASANVQPQPSDSTFGGKPVLLFGEGDGPVDLTWDGGRLDLPISFNTANSAAVAETLRLLQGARLITDWESRYPNADALAPLEKRKQNRLAMRLRELSRTYELASREMSLVAVVKRAGDHPGELPETRIVAVGVPQDTEFTASFGQFAIQADAFLGTSLCRAEDTTRIMGISGLKHRSYRIAGSAPAAPSGLTPLREPPRNADDILLELASQIEPDGGMPGADPDGRACATLLALLAFLSHGHTSRAGAFRSHITRLIGFLKAMNTLNEQHGQTVSEILEKTGSGWTPAGDWTGRALDATKDWDELSRVTWTR